MKSLPVMANVKVFAIQDGRMTVQKKISDYIGPYTNCMTPETAQRRDYKICPTCELLNWIKVKADKKVEKHVKVISQD